MDQDGINNTWVSGLRWNDAFQTVVELQSGSLAPVPALIQEKAEPTFVGPAAVVSLGYLCDLRRRTRR